MTKVALYARYSSDNQSVASIEDQFRICREQAAREKWKVVGTYHGAAISGASVTLSAAQPACMLDGTDWHNPASRLAAGGGLALSGSPYGCEEASSRPV
jgi:Resolvase, N terminal domain